MSKTAKISADTNATVTSSNPTADHLQVTVSGPPEHVIAALSMMHFHQPVTPLLCQQIAIKETKVAGAKASDTLGKLGMLSSESRTAYAQRCALDLKEKTGYNIDPRQLPQDSDTTVQRVSEAMYDATT